MGCGASSLSKKPIQKETTDLIMKLSNESSFTLESIPNWKTLRIENVNSIENNWTLLHIAAYFDQRNLIKEILKEGFDPNTKDCEFELANGETALHLAAYQGHFESVTILVNGGADIGAKNKVRIIELEETPIILALNRKLGKIGEFLAKNREKDDSLFFHTVDFSPSRTTKDELKIHSLVDI